MYISRIELINWKNFPKVAVNVSERCFIVGANAAGKSNLLDAIRFLRDISKTGGGLQYAVKTRGGMKKIRSLASHNQTDVCISVDISEPGNENPLWKYSLTFVNTGGGVVENQVLVKNERVYSSAKDAWILERNQGSVNEDKETLKYTHLEQVMANKEFRDLKSFFENISYLNIVPQYVKDSSIYNNVGGDDYYGKYFLSRLAQFNENTCKAYLDRINPILSVAVPQLNGLSFSKDANGVPHLEVRCKHWRAHDAIQQEDQLSDGTIRLIGFLFALQDAKGTLLLEEPENNLHTAVIEKLPEFIAKVQRTKKNLAQVIITTHSYELLADVGIAADEVLLLRTSKDGTQVKEVSDIENVEAELKAGFSVADSIAQYTRPDNIDEITDLHL